MNAIELLKMQHQEVEQLFEQVEKVEGLQKQAIFMQIADALTVHATLEEQIFYPAVKEADTENLLEEAVEEHFAMKQLIAELIDMGAEAEAFDGKLQALKTAVLHHVKDEEEPQLFPKVRQMMDEDTLEALGEEMTELMVTVEAEGTPSDLVFDELDAPAPI